MVCSIFQADGGQKKKTRARKQTVRYGQSSASTNKDSFFENSDNEAGASDTDGDADATDDGVDGSGNETSASDNDDSNSNNINDASGTEIESSSWRNGSQNSNASVSRTQISRVEAKLDGILDVLKKVQRTVNGLATNSTSAGENDGEEEFLSKFPLTTMESVTKFEEDLEDKSFRQSVVSI